MQGKNTSKYYKSMIIIIIIMLALNVLLSSTLTGFEKLSVARGQGDNTTVSLTPEQKAAMCDPNNPASMLKSVNTTESRICGIPKTQSSNATTLENTTSSGGISTSETPLPFIS
jgi:hypothetical protein